MEALGITGVGSVISGKIQDSCGTLQQCAEFTVLMGKNRVKFPFKQALISIKKESYISFPEYLSCTKPFVLLIH